MENHQGASANLLFCVNQKMLGLMGVCLKSLLRSGGYGHYDVFVLHSDLEESIQRAVERDFQERVTFHFLQVPEELFADFPETGRYPRQIYYRLAAPLLLPKEFSIWMWMWWLSTRCERFMRWILRAAIMWAAPTPGNF